MLRLSEFWDSPNRVDGYFGVRLQTTRCRNPEDNIVNRISPWKYAHVCHYRRILNSWLCGAESLRSWQFLS